MKLPDWLFPPGLGSEFERLSKNEPELRFINFKINCISSNERTKRDAEDETRIFFAAVKDAKMFSFASRESRVGAKSWFCFRSQSCESAAALLHFFTEKYQKNLPPKPKIKFRLRSHQLLNQMRIKMLRLPVANALQNSVTVSLTTRSTESNCAVTKVTKHLSALARSLDTVKEDSGKFCQFICL